MISCQVRPAPRPAALEREESSTLRCQPPSAPTASKTQAWVGTHPCSLLWGDQSSDVGSVTSSSPRGPPDESGEIALPMSRQCEGSGEVDGTVRSLAPRLLLGLWRVLGPRRKPATPQPCDQVRMFPSGTPSLWPRLRSPPSTLLLLLLAFGLCVDLGAACGPGRGAGRRRAPRKLTPLVYKQHVPNVPENTLSAAGVGEGKISRENPKFKQLVPNYNSDIVFRDDEGTGADRLMTQRCKEKLNTLAISVMNQWPGVRLRVIEGWDEENTQTDHSLHYEGRAVDITTSDKDRSKYGMLARLAVEAGFDWVYYESRAHIHCSVKPDSAQTSRTGGCFSANSTVTTAVGPKKMADLVVGDSVLAVNSDGLPVFSPVLLMLDRDEREQREFFSVRTHGGRKMTLTPSHLIYLTREEQLSGKEVLFAADVVFAKGIEDFDFLLVIEDSGRLVPDRVAGLEAVGLEGVFAPLTAEGNLVVDGALASCYALIEDQQLAHFAFAPVRLAANMASSLRHLWANITRFVSFGGLWRGAEIQQRPSTRDQTEGLHWYASLLYSLTRSLLPPEIIYD